MADQETTHGNPRAELERVEAELAELVEDIRGVRDSLTDSGPMDIEDRAGALSQIEELERIQDRLEQRRDSLREELGAG